MVRPWTGRLWFDFPPQITHRANFVATSPQFATAFTCVAGRSFQLHRLCSGAARSQKMVSEPGDRGARESNRVIVIFCGGVLKPPPPRFNARVRDLESSMVIRSSPRLNRLASHRRAWTTPRPPPPPRGSTRACPRWVPHHLWLARRSQQCCVAGSW